MNSSFSGNISLLRKEKALSQKQAAAELGVSQALLSHYENGIRECGLDFLVRAAAYFGVSCDFLLGVSTDRTPTASSAENAGLLGAAAKIKALYPEFEKALAALLESAG